MPGAKVYFDLADTSDERFDRPIEFMLIALIAVSALALGSVEPWSEAIFIGLSLAMGLTLCLKLLMRPDVQFVRSWTYIPIVLFLLLIIFQLLPLPASLVRLISPHTYQLRMKLLSDLPNAADRLRWMTLSFYPENTLHDLGIIAALACVFVVAVNCVRRVSQIRRLLGSIAIIGGAFAVLALVQDVLGSRSIYGLIDVPFNGLARAGPFINHSHFGQFMNLAVGAALGLGLVLLNQHFRRDNYSPREVAEKLRSKAMRPAWLLMLMIVLGLSAIVLSLSRGAMLSAAVAGLLVGVYVSTRRGAHGQVWIIIGAALCVLVVTMLNANTVLNRWMQQGEAQHGNRWDILRDLPAAWKQFPLFGTGLGTHSVIFPMFDRSTFPFLATYAENEYAQLLTESGGIGFVIAASFLVIVLAALVRAARGALSPASSAAIGLAYGLIAILVHSFTDFGQHIPAVAVLTAVTCALLLNLATLRLRELDRISSALPERGWLWTRTLALVGLLAGAVWAGREWYTRVRADQYWRVARRIDEYLQQRDWIAENPEYADILTSAKGASDWRPKNILYHYSLNFYRWKSLARATDPDTGEVMLDDERRGYIRRIVDELHAGRWLCPTYGQTYLLAGQLEREYIPEKREAARAHLELALELSGADPQAAFTLGLVEARDGNIERATELLRRAVRISSGLLADVIDIYVNELNRPDLALDLAGDNVDALQGLADMLAKNPQWQALAEQARQRQVDALQRAADRPNADPNVLVRFADLLLQKNRMDEAAAYLRNAIKSNYGQTDWHMKLAKTYEAMGRYDDALREAEITLRQRQLPEAKDLSDRMRARVRKSATTSSR